MPYMQICFGMCERLLLEGLHHCGEHLREALRGASSQRFTFSPASISSFLGVGFCLCFGFCVVVCVLLCVVCLCFPHDSEIYLVVCE